MVGTTATAPLLDTRPESPGSHAYLTFYGCSDDLVEVEGNIPGCDEYNTDDAEFDVAGLRVRVHFTRQGTWAITVAQVDEDVPVLALVEQLAPDGYTMKLGLRVPASSYVVRVDRDDA